jgi:hypothetical protein
MQIPLKDGRMTVSVSQLRVYGAGGNFMDDQEDDRGCPRLYEAKYVNRDLPDEEPSYPLIYGSLLHSVLQKMIDDGMDPESAIEASITTEHTIEMVDELKADIEKYLNRGADPHDRLAVLGTEEELYALLYVDPEFGEVWMRGFIDKIEIDPDDMTTLHVTDYKSNRAPLDGGYMSRDVQMRGYDWLVRQNKDRWLSGKNAQIVSHLDLVKYRDYEYVYTDREIDAWKSWAIAVARTILRDSEAAPVVNQGCPHCPIRTDCPAFLAAPEKARGALSKLKAGGDLATQQRVRDELNATRLMLMKAVKAWDDLFKAAVKDAGVLSVGDKKFVWDAAYDNVIDKVELARILGPAFAKLGSVSKKAIEESDLPPDVKLAALRCWRREIVGMGVRNAYEDE